VLVSPVEVAGSLVQGVSANAVAESFEIGVLLLGLPLSLVVARDIMGLQRRVQADVRRGRTVVFGRDTAERVVLPESGVVLSVGGKACKPGLRVVIVEAAAPPGTDPTPSTLDELSANPLERILSSDERSELARRAARMRRPHPALLAITFLAALGALMLVLRNESGFRILPRWWPALLGLILSWWGVFRARVLRRRLEADRRAGIVVRSGVGADPDTEVLPVSRLLWTIGGAPAPWRHTER
jgi:hypothetical protein